MTLQTWCIDETSHSADLARVQTYATSAGQQGVSGPTHLKVTPQTVPNGTVQILSGSAIVLATSPLEGQAYCVYNPTSTSVTIPATGGSARSDLVVARIADPKAAGTAWTTGMDIVAIDVIGGVPASTMTMDQVTYPYPAIPLARIDMPANTGTVTKALIQDLRRIHTTRAERQIFMSGQGSSSEETISNTNGDRVFAMLQPQLFAPEWANILTVIATVNQLGHRAPNNGDPSGKALAILSVSYGNAHDPTRVTQWRSDNTWLHADGPDSRETWGVAGRMLIPTNLRGTTQTLSLEGKKITDHGSVGEWIFVEGTHVVFDVMWERVAE